VCPAGAGAHAPPRAGAEVFRGDVNDLDRLRTAAEAADGVLHAAFNHDFANSKQNSEDHRKIIQTLGDALIAKGVRIIVMRLPQVHDTRKQGRITLYIKTAQQKGRVAYVGEGKNR